MKTEIEGITYLLAQEEGGPEYVTQHGREGMQEVFTAAEIAQLAAGEAVVKQYRLGMVRYVDMVAAARPVHAAG